MIAQLAEELAAQMGAPVLWRGKVPCLMAPDWYDDGPQDLCNRFVFLQKDSSFRKSLKSITPNALIAALTKAFDPLALNALTLPLILELDELEERPELILPLLPFIESCQELSDNVWLRAARLAHQAGASGFAQRVLRSRAVPYLLKLHKQQQGLDSEAITLLIKLAPSAALQMLRRTRQRGVQSDHDETDPTRRESLAQAHEALGRPLRAKRLRENAKNGQYIL